MRRVGSDATTPQTAEEVTARVAAEPRACDGDSEERIKRVAMKRVKVAAEKGDLFFFIVRKNGFFWVWGLRLFLRHWQRKRVEGYGESETFSGCLLQTLLTSDNEVF